MALTTRFGSSLESPRLAANVLRAVCVRHDIALQDVSDTDLVAAVIAADSWMLVTSAQSFSQAGSYGDAASICLANIMLRAAGRALPFHAVVPGRCTSDSTHIAAVQGYIAWAYRHLGELAPEAMRRAASDLSVDNPSGRFAALAELLLTAAALPA